MLTTSFIKRGILYTTLLLPTVLILTLLFLSTGLAHRLAIAQAYSSCADGTSIPQAAITGGTESAFCSNHGGSGGAGSAGAACSGDSSRGFLGFPKWYTYLPGTIETNVNGVSICHPIIDNINDFWLIGAAVVEILLRFASLLAIGFVVYGGVEYIQSQGEPDRLQKARGTILYAIIGLVVSIGAATIITFIAGQFG